MSYKDSNIPFIESMEISHKKEVMNMLILHVLHIRNRTLRVREISSCINENNHKAYSFIDLNQAVFRISQRGFLIIQDAPYNQSAGRYCTLTNEGKTELFQLKNRYMELTMGTLNVLELKK